MATDRAQRPVPHLQLPARDRRRAARRLLARSSGLTAEGDAVDYREGTDVQSNVRKLPGLRKYTNITLKRGYTQDKSLWHWYTNIVNGVGRPAQRHDRAA